MTRGDRLAMITLTILVGFFVAFVYHFVIIAEMLEWPYPYNTFLFRPQDRFMDFGNGWMFGHGPYQDRADHGAFPFLFLICSATHLLSMEAALVVFLVVGTSVTWWHCASELHESSWLQSIQSSAPLVLFSYPMIMVLERGNYDLCILGCLIFFDRNYRWERYLRSALWLGAAIAIKPFAIVYLALFAAKRQWLPLAVTPLVAIGLTLGSLCLMVGGFSVNLNQWLKNLSHYQDYYGLGYQGSVYTCSLFSGIKWIYFFNDSQLFRGTALKVWERPYFWFGVLVYLTTAGVVVFLESRYWRQLLGLTLTALMLPFCCGDYRQIYLLLPLLQFVKDPMSTRTDWAIALLLGLLLIPKHWVRVHGSEISSSAILSPLLLLVLWLAIVIPAIMLARQRVNHGARLPTMAAPDPVVNPLPEQNLEDRVASTERGGVI